MACPGFLFVCFLSYELQEADTIKINISAIPDRAGTCMLKLLSTLKVLNSNGTAFFPKYCQVGKNHTVPTGNPHPTQKIATKHEDSSCLDVLSTVLCFYKQPWPFCLHEWLMKLASPRLNLRFSNPPYIWKNCSSLNGIFLLCFLHILDAWRPHP